MASPTRDADPLVVRAGDGRPLLTILDWAKNPSHLKAPITAILRSRIKKTREGKCIPVVVADVDDTIIRQSPYDENKFVHEPLGAWLFEWCMQHGMHGHIITARQGTADAKAFLLQQLRRAGIRDPPAEEGGERLPLGKQPPVPNAHAIRVYMRPRKHHDISQAKSEARQLFAANERIVVTVGDQLGDHMHLTEMDEVVRCEERFNPCTYYLFCQGVPSANSVLCVKTPEMLGNWPHEPQQHPRRRDVSTARWSL